MKRILLVEDDGAIVAALTAFLEEDGFEAVCAAGQREAQAILEREPVALALVDLALREGTGFGVCAAARQRGIPVIFLTASTDETSVVTGLDMGADDYIGKPFRPRELVSRIRTVLRRCAHTQTVELPGGVTADLEKGKVWRDGAEIPLSALEFRLLSALVSCWRSSGTSTATSSTTIPLPSISAGCEIKSRRTPGIPPSSAPCGAWGIGWTEPWDIWGKIRSCAGRSGAVFC